MADTAGYAIITPTYGSGRWRLDKNSTVLNAIYEYCIQENELDHRNIYLSGISNGATGVTRAIQNHGKRYKGFILISPVIESAIISYPSFIGNAKNRPFLIIHGEQDRRVPFAQIDKCKNILEHNNLSVSASYYPAEDHFLLFAQRVSVIRALAAWLKDTKQ